MCALEFVYSHLRGGERLPYAVVQLAADFAAFLILRLTGRRTRTECCCFESSVSRFVTLQTPESRGGQRFKHRSDVKSSVLDRSGVSQFKALLSRKGEDAAVFYAFDSIWTNGTDLRGQPLVERREQLHGLVRKSRCQRLLYAQHIDGAGKQFFEHICERDLEGIVAKRKMGIYKDDGNTWLKIKNRSYSQAEGRHETLQAKRRS